MLTKEDIILVFLDNPNKLATEIWKGNVPKSDESRTLICNLGDPMCAYYYTSFVDKKPTDETRTVACKTPQCAYGYARDVDKKPTDETRTAACKDPYEAYCYARDIDKKSTDETREAAYKNEVWGRTYELWENSLKKI